MKKLMALVQFCVSSFYFLCSQLLITYKIPYSCRNLFMFMFQLLTFKLGQLGDRNVEYAIAFELHD